MYIHVGVDFDDTLFDFAGALNQYVNKGYVLEDYKDTYTTVWNVSQEEANEIISAFSFGDGPKCLQQISPDPIEGAKEFFERVNRNIYKFYLISARAEKLMNNTKQLLDLHFPGIFEKVILCNYYSGGPKRCKTDVCKELGITI